MTLSRLAGLILFLAAQFAPQQAHQATVSGTVTRIGTSEPLADVQVTLEGGPLDAKVMQTILSTAASGGIVVTPRENASLAEVTQLLTNAAIARSLPNGAVAMRNLVSRTVGAGVWPTASSDRDGKFEFKDVRPGTYTVRVQRDGYFGKAVGGAYPRTGSVDVTVREPKSHEVSLSLVPGTNISGRIYSASGELLGNVNVQAFTVAYQNGIAVLQQAAAKVTDDRGEYRLVWVPPGSYYIGVTPRPAPGAVAGLQSARTYYPGTTRFTDARLVTIYGGEDLPAIDIAIRTASAFKISGQITSLIPPAAGAPAASIALGTNAFLEFNSRDLDASSDPSAATRIISLASGRFELPNMLPGRYELFARVTDPSRTGLLQNAAWGHAVVDVRDADVNGIAIVIDRSVDLKGTVSLPDNVKLPSSVRIALLPDGTPSKIPLYQLVSTRGTTVGNDGTFTVDAVPPGRFRLSALAGLPSDMYVADVRRGSQSVFDSGFEVTPTATEPIEIVVRAGSGTVDGVLLDAVRKPFVGGTVVLAPVLAKRENRALYLSTVSDAGGAFKIQGVPPGDYKLFSWESIPANAFMNAEFLASYEDRGRIVHVAERGVATTELTVIPVQIVITQGL